MTSPVVVGDTIYMAVQSYGDRKRTLMQWLDTNQDGRLARAETPVEFHAKFDRSDKNKDKVLDAKEIETAFQSPNNLVGGGNTIQAVRGGERGDITKTHLRWDIDNKAPSNLSSPLVFNDRVYVVKSGGLSSCFNAADGKTHWDRTRLRAYGDYYASPIAGDEATMVLRTDADGIVLREGAQVEIGGNERYLSVCRKHFKEGMAERQPGDLPLEES